MCDSIYPSWPYFLCLTSFAFYLPYLCFSLSLCIHTYNIYIFTRIYTPYTHMCHGSKDGCDSTIFLGGVINFTNHILHLFWYFPSYKAPWKVGGCSSHVDDDSFGSLEVYAFTFHFALDQGDRHGDLWRHFLLGESNPTFFEWKSQLCESVFVFVHFSWGKSGMDFFGAFDRFEQCGIPTKWFGSQISVEALVIKDKAPRIWADLGSASLRSPRPKKAEVTYIQDKWLRNAQFNKPGINKQNL